MGMRETFKTHDDHQHQKFRDHVYKQYEAEKKTISELGWPTKELDDIYQAIPMVSGKMLPKKANRVHRLQVHFE